MGHAGRTAVQQYVWRSVGIEIGLGRYDRTGWVREPVFERDRDMTPSRATEGKIKRKVEQPKKKGRGPEGRYCPADCPEERFYYRLQRVETTPPNHITLRVVAMCTGPQCGGRERTFPLVSWCNPQLKLRGCSRCVAALRRDERRAQRQAIAGSGKSWRKDVVST